MPTAERRPILTPHAGELGRLLGRSSEEIAAKRLSAAREAAATVGAVVVLKGDDTIVTDGERVAVNALAAPALATAGTGDVLSGITAAMLARGLEPFAAACAAVFAHARAGGDAARRVGLAESVIATDVIDSIPAGLRTAVPSNTSSNEGAARRLRSRRIRYARSLRRHLPMKTAAEIMDADVPTVSPEADARAAIELLAKTEIGALPVIDTDRKVVGIVSESDLILSDEEADLHLPHYLNIMGGIVFVGSMKGFEKRLDKAFATKVSELMTADPIVARSDDDAETVARVIAEKHHNHLPVVDGEGRLAGLVTRADALAALVAGD